MLKNKLYPIVPISYCIGKQKKFFFKIFAPIFFYDKHIPQWHLKLSKLKQKPEISAIHSLKDYIQYLINTHNTVQQDKTELKIKNGFLEFLYLFFSLNRYNHKLSLKESFLSMEIKELVGRNHILKVKQRIEQILLNQGLEKRHLLFQYSLNQLYNNFLKLNIFGG